MPVHVITAAESAQLRATLKGHEGPVWQVAWAPDGRTLASLSILKGEVKLWDVAGRKERAALRSDLGNSYGLAFTPDGKTLLVGRHQTDGKAGPTGGVELWDVGTGQRKGLLRHTPPRVVTRLALSPDGKLLAAVESWKEGEKGEYKSCLTLWDVAAGKPVARLADENTGALAFSPDGKVLAWSAYVIKDRKIASACVRRRDVAKRQDLPALENTAAKSPLGCLAFSPDGRTLAGADFAGHVLLWDTASGKVRSALQQGDRWRVSSLAFAPDGKALAAALANRSGRDHEPGAIVLWDAATGKRRLTLTGHTNAVLSVAFSPDGKLLASGSSDRTVRLWEMTAPASAEAGGGK